MYTSMCEDLIQASVRARKIAKVGAADNREFSVDVTQPQSSAKKKKKRANASQGNNNSD